MKTFLLLTTLFIFANRAKSATTIQAELVSASTTVTNFSGHDECFFDFQVKLTASGGDFYLLPNPIETTGFGVLVERNGSPTSSTYYSLATPSGNNIIQDGSSEVFLLRTYLIPNLTGMYRTSLSHINWGAETDGGGSEYGTLFLDSSFRSNYVALRGVAAMVPEPSRLFLLGLGIMSLGFRRRRE